MVTIKSLSFSYRPCSTTWLANLSSNEASKHLETTAHGGTISPTSACHSWISLVLRGLASKNPTTPLACVLKHQWKGITWYISWYEYKHARDRREFTNVHIVAKSQQPSGLHEIKCQRRFSLCAFYSFLGTWEDNHGRLEEAVRVRP